MKTFLLPELGENIESATVVNLLVSPGEAIKKGQPVLELETDKAVFEVPSSQEGKVAQVHVKVGDRLKVRDLVLSLEGEEAGPQTSPEDANRSSPPSPQPVAKPLPPRPEEKEEKVYASPLVRKQAREAGVSLSEIKHSDPSGRITRDDLVRSLKKPSPQSRQQASSPKAILPDFSQWGSIERLPLSETRKKIAETLSQSWIRTPQVTQFDQADVTELEELRKRFSSRVEQRGGKLTWTAILLKIVASGLRVFPQFNRSLDDEEQNIIQKHYIHLGVAVDTERGLLLPVLRNVDEKNILEIAIELQEMVEKARNKRLKPEDFQGGSFSITNLGGIGGGHFTPIVHWPEVAILGIGKTSLTPVWKNEKFEPRFFLPLSLSYDHRLIDGAEAARFLRWLAAALEEPFLMELEG